MSINFLPAPPSKPSMPQSRELDLSVILEATEKGSTAAFQRLYERYADKVRYAVARAAQRRCHTRDVDELNQEVWCRLLDNERRLLRRFDPNRGRFEPFISTVAYQQALMAVERHERQVPHGDVDVGDGSLVDDGSLHFAEDLVQSELFHKLLARADVELGDDERMLLRELYLEQRSCRSLASELGVSENAVYKRSERLRKKLVRMVEELLATSPHLGGPRLPVAMVLGLVAAAHVLQASAGGDGGVGSGRGSLSSSVRFRE
jgi:RNA polymerase sigma factor (sigma-70 family)